MKKNLSKLCVHSQKEFLDAMQYFKRVDKRRAKNKVAKKSRRKNNV
jgi:hypothetical protein